MGIFAFLLYLFTQNWTGCVSYGFHNAVLHSSSWHGLCLTAASALSLALSCPSFSPIFPQPRSPSHNAEPAESCSLSLSAFLTQSKAKGEEIRKGWIEQKNKAKVEHKNQAKKKKSRVYVVCWSILYSLSIGGSKVICAIC